MNKICGFYAYEKDAQEHANYIKAHSGLWHGRPITAEVLTILDEKDKEKANQ